MRSASTPNQSRMSATQYLVPEFDQEMRITRRLLERVPEDGLNWQPHPKSYTLGQLASHVAQLPDWISYIFSGDEFDFRPAGGPVYQSAKCGSRAELLDLFDRSVAKARTAMETARDETLDTEWSLKAGERTIMSRPRWAVYRGFGLNHLVHHRAQLGVYLRLLEVPVPESYGPSADSPQG